MEKVQKTMTDLLTIKGAEDYAHTRRQPVSQWLILRAVSSGTLKCQKMKIGGKERIFFDRKELDRWLALQSDR